MFIKLGLLFLLFVLSSHLNSVVRKCTAQHLSSLVEKVGAARLLSGAKDLTDRLLPAVSKLSQDSSQEARWVMGQKSFHLTLWRRPPFFTYNGDVSVRYFGRRMLLLLSYHRDFDKMLEKFVPAKDLPTIRDAVFTLKTKVRSLITVPRADLRQWLLTCLFQGLGEMPQDAPSARGRRSLPGTSSLTPLVSNRWVTDSVSSAQDQIRVVLWWWHVMCSAETAVSSSSAKQPSTASQTDANTSNRWRRCWTRRISGRESKPSIS